MKLDKEQIKHIASLARLGLSDDDIDMFSVQLSEVLDNFDILKRYMNNLLIDSEAVI